VIKGQSPFLTYGYITGRLRVLETTLITPAQWQRMAAANSLYELQTVLAETVYGDALRDVAAAEDAEAVLNRFLAQNYQLINESIANKQVKESLNLYFRAKYDFLNLKSLLKSGFGQEISWPLSPLGLIAPETLSRLISGEEKLAGVWFSQAGLTIFTEAVAAAAAQYDRYRRLEIIDVALDKAYYWLLLETAKQLKSSFVTNLTKYLIDLANLKIIKRCLAGVALVAPLSEYLISGGFLAPESLALVTKVAKLLPLLSAWPDTRLQALVTNYLTTNTTKEYDYLTDQWLSLYLQAAKLQVVGVEIVVAYLLQRELEIKQVRTLLLAHLAAVKPEFIREWVVLSG
jgi:V/A-type H+-transporting ATPase subunit C